MLGDHTESRRRGFDEDVPALPLARHVTAVAVVLLTFAAKGPIERLVEGRGRR